MRVAIVGCGPLGRERARFLGEEALAVFDRHPERAAALASACACEIEADVTHCVRRADIDAVVLADDATTEVALAAAEAGKHLLIERPAAFSIQDLLTVFAAAERKHLIVYASFRYRHQPVFQAAQKLIKSNVLGPLYYVRGRIGHQRDEHREPVDVYLDLVDMARWFLGEFSTAHGRIGSCFWDMPIDDNGFVYLSSPSGHSAWLHAEASDWLNPVHFEIFGRDGKVEIDGLRTLRWQSKQRGTQVWNRPNIDRSHEAEIDHFRDCVELGQTPMGSLVDALAALRLVGQLEHVEPATTRSRRAA